MRKNFYQRVPWADHHGADTLTSVYVVEHISGLRAAIKHSRFSSGGAQNGGDFLIDPSVFLVDFFRQISAPYIPNVRIFHWARVVGTGRIRLRQVAPAPFLERWHWRQAQWPCSHKEQKESSRLVRAYTISTKCLAKMPGIARNLRGCQNLVALAGCVSLSNAERSLEDYVLDAVSSILPGTGFAAHLPTQILAHRS
jgi:hypothetical protein